MKHDLKHLINEFLEYLEIERGRSKNTIRNYHFYLNRFSEFSKCATPRDITLDTVRKFRLFLNREATQGGLEKNTQNYHLIALRSFLKYLAKRDIPSLSPEKIELAKMPERQVEFLEKSDLERLLEAPLQTEENKIIQHRDKALLEVLFSTGLRVSEASSLTREQINLKKDEFTIRGKGLKLRIAFLSNQAKFWLKKYLDLRHDTALWLFIRHDKAKGAEEPGPLTPRSIQRTVQKYSKMAGITKKVTPHTMRHSFATDLLANGADIRSVQELLGHSSITTTQVYTHISDKRLKEAHKTFHNKPKTP